MGRRHQPLCLFVGLPLQRIFTDPEFAPILERDLEDGQHRNPTTNSIYFTDAYFHKPGELSREFLAAGFQVLEIAAIEGPGWLARDFDRLWNDPVQRERLLTLFAKWSASLPFWARARTSWRLGASRR